MVRAKQRITRNNKVTTRRKAAFEIGGENVNYDDSRIKKAINNNWDLSNQLIFDATTPDKKPQKRKHALETVENMPNTQKKAKKKPALSRKKPPAVVKNDGNNAEVKQIQAMFDDAYDFQLMTEVVPKVNDQYVVKPKKVRSRRRCIDHITERSTANEIVNESALTAQEIVNESIPKEIVDERKKSEQMEERIDTSFASGQFNFPSRVSFNVIIEETKQINHDHDHYHQSTSTAQEIVDKSTANEIVDGSTANEIVDESTANEIVNESASTAREIVDESTSTTREIVKESTSTAREIVNESASTAQEIVNESTAQEIVDESTSTAWEIIKESTANKIFDESTAQEIVDESTAKEIVKESTSTAQEIVDESTTREIVDKSTAREIVNESTAREIVNESTTREIVKESTSTAQEIVDESTAREIVNESTSTAWEIVKESTANKIFDESTAQEIVDENENIEIGPSDEEKNLHVLLDLCEATNVVSWDKFVSSSSTSFENCSKLGEGTYGEVFKISINDKECALKVIPFAVTAEEGNKIVNGDYLKPPMSTYNELLITRELSKLADEGQTALIGFVTHGFIRLIRFAIVKGFYPEPLLKAWDRYKIDRPSLAENQRPTEYATKEQHFILFALSNGGVDLESFRIQKQRESFSIFYQIAYSLAIAEEALEFEHRDLHIGNVLIDECDDHEIIKFVFDGEDVNIRSCGVRTSIIDFTNSRIRKDELVVYIDLSEEEEIFNGQGDYQFDIYRLMRDVNKNNWAEFKPKTNLLWLHYLSRKLFDIPRLFRKRRKPILEMFDKLLTAERVRDFLNDDEFLEEFADFRA